jgi:hypothetical protein
MSDEKIFLSCSFDDKDECKSLGGKWDGDAKKWYITDDMDTKPFEQWMGNSEDVVPVLHHPDSEPQSIPSGEKTYLNCPFEDKDECKSLGGKWDSDAKKWYVSAGEDNAPFEKWIIDASKPLGKWPG